MAHPDAGKQQMIPSGIWPDAGKKDIISFDYIVRPML